jgi:hypothetical protein
MASWGVLLALEDYDYDGPQQKLGFSPKIQQDNFRGFFSGAEGWGSIGQKRTPAFQTNTISLDYGKIDLSTLETTTTKRPAKVEVSVAGKKIPCTYTYQDGQLLVLFDALTLTEGQQLLLSAS